MSINKTKVLTYALLALALVIGYQQARLWFKALEISPVASIYRHRPAPRVIPPEAPKKGEKVVTLPCVPLEVIQPVSSQPDASEGHYTIGRWDIPESPRGGLVVVEVDKESGKSQLTYTPATLGLAEWGKSRYATLWGGYAINSEAEKTLSLKLELESDFFRVGPLWARGRGGLYAESTTLKTNEKINDVGVYVEAGIGVSF